MKNYFSLSKYYNAILAIIILLSIFLSEASAQIVQASSVDEIKKYTSRYKSGDSLVLTDIDYVLLAPRDRVLRYAGEKDNYRAKQFKYLFQDFKGKEILLGNIKIPMSEYLISQILSSAKVELVSPNMPSLINDFKFRNITVVGFTANGRSRYGIVQNESELHASRLKSLGYNFIKDNSDLFKTNFPECISHIIYTNKEDKGAVILRFLKHLNKNYNNIILIDDRLKNLISVQNALKSYEINYLGINYTELEDKNELLNRDIADKQFQILREEHIWLGDDEVKMRLKYIKD